MNIEQTKETIFSPQINGSEIRILVVDDREENLFSIESILQQDGYQLFKARSGKEALKILLKEYNFSLILMDVQMPELNGFDTASMIYEREKLKGIPIIFITAYDYSDENIYKGYKMGAVDYIFKPVNTDLLRAKISVFIELYKKNQQLKLHEQKLIAINNELEIRVNERTDELVQKNVELKLKNEELERINTDLDHFIYAASHDLKAPVANIEALIDILSKKITGKLDSEESSFFQMLNLSVNKLNQTIRDLTEIVSVHKDTGGKIELIKFEDIFNDIKIDSKKYIEESEAVINEFFDVSEISYVKTNLRSICYNLFTNALKFRDKERQLKVQVQTYKKNGYITLSVADNGLGIKEEYKNKMFKMFHRFHSHIEGSGIGLYIVKRIVENHGGFIEVDSVYGKGTTFKIYLKNE